MKTREEILQEYNDTNEEIFTEMEGIIEESARVTAVVHKTPQILRDLDAEFKDKTKLNDDDEKILFLATALQVGRWVLIGFLNTIANEKLDSIRMKHNDNDIKQWEKGWREKYKKFYENESHIKSQRHRDYFNIAMESVPYDATRGSTTYGINMEGGYHRIHTLGHDPVLGWIFGVMNLLSDTITLDKTYGFATYNVMYRPKPLHWAQPGEHKPGLTTIPNAFIEAYDAVCEDDRRLGAAVFAQALHLGSDVFTKLGLPVPVLETFCPEIASNLYKSGYDSLHLVKDIAVVGIQYVLAKFIDLLIISVHGLYYKESENRNLFDVRTSKILKYSNMISSGSNVIAVAAGVQMGYANALSYLDIGGMLNTAKRIVEDYKFQNKIKEEFVLGTYKKMIDGEA
jgi:hypothetical protein